VSIYTCGGNEAIFTPVFALGFPSVFEREDTSAISVMIEEEVSVGHCKSGWIAEKIEHARELLWAYCFYASEHQELVKDHVARSRFQQKTMILSDTTSWVLIPMGCLKQFLRKGRIKL
jgi:hypothetical protein